MRPRCTKVAEMIIKNFAEFDIDLNSEEKEGRKAFHLACVNGHQKIA